MLGSFHFARTEIAILVVNAIRYPYSLKKRKKWLSVGLPFSLREYESRIESVRKLAELHGLTAIVIHGDANENGFVRWLSNFEPLAGSTFIIIPKDGEPILVSDSVLHGEPLHSLWWMTWISDLRPSKYGVNNLTTAVVEILRKKNLISGRSRIGYVSDYGFPERFLKSCGPVSNLLNLYDEVSALKMVKSLEEIKLNASYDIDCFQGDGCGLRKCC